MPSNNLLDQNITDLVARVFLEKFETYRVLSKTVDTQLLEGRFNPSSGTRVRFKRPTDYVSVRTSDGDVSATNPSPIITGTAEGVVQDYFTTEVTYGALQEAIELDQLEQLLEPLAIRICTDLETDFAAFMLRNTGLLAGEVGTDVTTWDHVAEAGAVMMETGIPMDGNWYYTFNPRTQTALASNQRSLGAGGSAGELIDTAQKQATVSQNFAGMTVMTATTLAKYTSGAGADRTGTLAANPDVTYATARDTMQQTLSISGFQANLEIKAGEVVQIAGRNRLNLSTRDIIVPGNNSTVLFTGTVLNDVTLNGAGAGTIVISGPALFQTAEDGAYNTVDSAPVSGDVVTLLGSPSQVIQPNLFYHRQAFSIGSVPIPRLSSTDTFFQTKDGLEMRVSRDSAFRENRQLLRIDFQPAYAVLNPFFSGQGFGRP